MVLALLLFDRANEDEKGLREGAPHKQGVDVTRTVNRSGHQQAETLLRWFHMEALLDGEFLSWRETASGFQLFVNGVDEGHVTDGELRLLAAERRLYPEPDELLTPVPDSGRLDQLGEC